VVNWGLLALQLFAEAFRVPTILHRRALFLLSLLHAAASFSIAQIASLCGNFL
jgi:hypothetical protein